MLSNVALVLLAALSAAVAPVPSDIPFGKTGLRFDTTPNPILVTTLNKGGNPEYGQEVRTYYVGAGDVVRGWEMPADSGHIVVPGTDACLDAGAEPANGSRLKLGECADGAASQRWSVHDDRVELVGTGLCLDVRDGNPVPRVHPPNTVPDSGGLQLWECIDGNENQVFKLVDIDTLPFDRSGTA